MTSDRRVRPIDTPERLLGARAYTSEQADQILGGESRLDVIDERDI